MALSLFFVKYVFHDLNLKSFASHQDTLLCLNNLAGVLRAANEIDEAEECYKDSWCLKMR